MESVAMRPGMRLVIDLGEIPHVSSDVLGKLIRLKKQLHSVGGRLGLENVHPDLVEVFRMTRLDTEFDLAP
jgi:anti-sigma B factor antagonist